MCTINTLGLGDCSLCRTSYRRDPLQIVRDVWEARGIGGYLWNWGNSPVNPKAPWSEAEQIAEERRETARSAVRHDYNRVWNQWFNDSHDEKAAKEKDRMIRSILRHPVDTDEDEYWEPKNWPQTLDPFYEPEAVKRLRNERPPF